MKLNIKKALTIDSIKHLSTVVDLSTVEMLQLDFGLSFLDNTCTGTEMESLLESATKLHSLELRGVFFGNMEKILHGMLTSKLTCHVKYLKIPIISKRDVKAILENAKHLSSITFQGRYVWEFEQAIAEWLAQNYTDYTFQSEPIPAGLCSCEVRQPPLHIWFGQRTNEQSENTSRHKRLKLTHSNDNS